MQLAPFTAPAPVIPIPPPPVPIADHPRYVAEKTPDVAKYKLPWVKVYTDFDDHKKTLRLQRIIGDTADCYPQRLWRWCLRECKNGKPSIDIIESACRWKGPAGQLLAALIESEFLNSDGSIRNWHRRGGNFLTVEADAQAAKKTRREKRAARNRAWRKREKAKRDRQAK